MRSAKKGLVPIVSRSDWLKVQPGLGQLAILYFVTIESLLSQSLKMTNDLDGKRMTRGCTATKFELIVCRFSCPFEPTRLNSQSKQ